MTATEPGLAEVAALITIETTERLARHAGKAIIDGDTRGALELLDALTEETTRRTATRVKSLALSDRIAAGARSAVRYHLAAIDARRTPPAADDGETPPTHTGWVIHYLAHDDCTDCQRLIGYAIDTARATGSIGATYGEEPPGHEVTVRRAPVDNTTHPEQETPR